MYMYLLIDAKIGIKTIIWLIKVLFFVVHNFINTMWISRLLLYISISYVFITCLYSQSDIVEWSEMSVDDENLSSWMEQYEELSKSVIMDGTIRRIVRNSRKSVQF